MNKAKQQNRTKVFITVQALSFGFLSCALFSMCDQTPRIPYDLQDNMTLEDDKQIEHRNDTTCILSQKH